VDRIQLESIQQAYSDSTREGKNPFVMVGFNRRFAPATEQIRTFFAGRQEAMFIHARINAGFLPSNHWVQQPGEGGRIIGECCHFVDWARHIAGCSIHKVLANALPDGPRYSRDNVAVTLTFVDGSIAFDQIIEVTEATFAIHEAINTAEPVVVTESATTSAAIGS
jgi:predicted dehydrogenase